MRVTGRSPNPPLVLIAALIGFVFTSQASAQSNPSPSVILGDLQTAALTGGVNDRQFVQIGGIRQWLSVQGRHRDAPILLFLHGGPGLSSIPAGWGFLAPWREYFILAQGDQRGTARPAKRTHPLRLPRQ